jgi:hypothetical protein
METSSPIIAAQSTGKRAGMGAFFEVGRFFPYAVACRQHCQEVRNAMRWILSACRGRKVDTLRAIAA